ncbi:ABC transporter substrate-binding protein [Synoicihabitans lomoniglobus]|uniref:Thiamine pyrimidine synthase n=1 Tax=Synoicihabitans lomoniglobus TaxID=2909285 RepID=A0AAF0I4P9_9BACT|nr:ABC transporter substrate-binding protein [Opitutaceae bacterium LMO-M01]WED66615.1 ABC transporter substrate-binding protein [Opitutaceae bacterium LMO-M01]
MVRRTLAVAWWGIATLALPMRAESTQLVMQLDLGVQNVQFAGVLWAQSEGWFSDAGIDLEIRPLPDGYGDLAAKVAASEHTIGSIESGLFLTGRAAGEPLVAIGAMFQASPLCLVAKSHHHLRTPADLVGLRVAVHGDGHEALATILAYSGVDASKVEIGEADYGNGPLLRDEVDAKQAYYVDEYVHMLTAGHAVDALRYKDFGHKAYSQVMFVSEATLAAHRAALVKFLQVLDRGWRAAVAAPEVAAKLVVTRYAPALDLTYQTESLKLMSELLWAEDERTGATSPVTWQANAASFLATHPESSLPPMERWVDFSLIEEAFARAAP